MKTYFRGKNTLEKRSSFFYFNGSLCQGPTVCSLRSIERLFNAQSDNSRARFFKMAFPTYYIAWIDSARTNPPFLVYLLFEQSVFVDACFIVRFHNNKDNRIKLLILPIRLSQT